MFAEDTKTKKSMMKEEGVARQHFRCSESAVSTVPPDGND